jgi:hypothetical protein
MNAMNTETEKAGNRSTSPAKKAAPQLPILSMGASRFC